VPVVLASLVTFSNLTPAHAKVTNVPLFVVEYDTQTSPTAVTSPLYYLSERTVEEFAGDVSAVSLTYPGSGGPVSYPAPIGGSTVSFYASPNYTTLAALNAAYPFGDYTTTYSGNDSGSDTVDYDHNDLATSTPTFTAATYDALQGLDASDGVDLDFNSFEGADPTSYVFVTIYNSATGEDVFDAGGGFLPSDTTSVFLPGDTLEAGTSYFAVLNFSNRDPATDGNDVDVSQNWDYDTSLSFTTAAAPESSSIVSLAVLIALGALGTICYRRKLSADH